MILSRAVTYSVLSLVTAAVAALVFSELGYEVDPVVVAVTVSISLAASVLFMGVSERLSMGVERVLFPKQARLARALAASKGELTSLRRRLERAEKLAIAGELAASVAHEIKNPLAPIRGYAQLLSGRLDQVAPEQRAVFEKALGIIREEADRIDRRVIELLELARADRTASSVEERLDLNRVVIEAAAVAEGEPGLARILQSLDPDIGPVVGNEDEMRGALLNLMKNAVEAMQGQSGATVQVTTRRENGRAVVEIADEGVGIDPTQAERVFKAFYTTKAGGTGLGLAIARSAVEAAGGSISLTERKDRGGAIARIELDLAPQGVVAEGTSRARSSFPP